MVPTPPQNPEDNAEKMPIQAEQVEEIPLPDEIGSAVQELPASAELATDAQTVSTLPPQAQVDTNGGPLGCCLGVMVGLTLSLVVAIVSRLYGEPLAAIFQGYLSLTVRIVMALVAIGGAIFFGYLGWKIGKKLYREYDPPVIKDRTRKPKPKGV
jgi:hypothetical protein